MSETAIEWPDGSSPRIHIYWFLLARAEWKETKQKRKLNFAVWLCIDRLEKLSNDNVGH